MMMTVESSFACSIMRVSASSCVLYKLSTSLQVTFVALKHFLSQVTYMTFFVKFCSQCLLLPVLGQDFDEIAIAFGWGQKTPPLLYFAAQLRCWGNKNHYRTHGWLFRHSLWIHHVIHQIPSWYGSSLPEYVTPIWKWPLKVQHRSCYRRELFEQGSLQRRCKLTVAVSLLLTTPFFQLSCQGGLACLYQRAITVAKRPWQWTTVDGPELISCPTLCLLQ